VRGGRAARGGYLGNELRQPRAPAREQAVEPSSRSSSSAHASASSASIESRFASKSKGGVEEYRAGEAYYLEPGHVPFFEEDCELVEFSPAED
jgi:hypothetical protein